MISDFLTKKSKKKLILFKRSRSTKPNWKEGRICQAIVTFTPKANASGVTSVLINTNYLVFQCNPTTAIRMDPNRKQILAKLLN